MVRSGLPSGRRGEIEPLEVDLPITLGQFVKAAGLADTGGDAKRLVVGGDVRVNGEVETRRGHKLAIGDVIQVNGRTVCVSARPQGPSRTPPPQV
jgi:ribosome-associated protein